nr:hypothetical protein K-LCC10_0246 [Kaumoebavirus]
MSSTSSKQTAAKPATPEVPETEKFLKTLLDDTKCGDVLIKCKDGERMVDSNILKKRSEYFAAMFANDMKETKTRTIELNHVEYAPLNVVLHQMYLGKLPHVSSFTQLIDAYCLCHEWNMVEFLEQYHDDQKRWAAPHHMLKYALAKYPTTATLCYVIANRFPELISNRNATLSSPNVLLHTDNLTRKIITYVAFNYNRTLKNITDIIDAHRNKKRKISEVGDVEEKDGAKKSKD